MSTSKYAPSNKIFDWVYVFFACWTVIGIYIDGWAHIHLGDALESFFTPWHAIFYSGVLFVGLTLLFALYRNHRRGYSVRHALPKEYLFSLVGIICMFIGGLGDMTWHEIFGIEVGMEALFSPTHLLLAIGGAIAMSGPLYAVWYRHKSHPIHAGPTILSTFCFMSVITFMLQFLHPLNYPWMAMTFLTSNPISFDFGIMLGMACILFFSVIMVGVILSTVKHWIYPFGSFTIILTLNAAATTLMEGRYYEFILSALIAGLFIDLFYWLLIKKSGGKISLIHLFAFVAPAVYIGLYILTISLIDTIAWSLHIWTGAIFMAGVAGYLVSYLVIPADSKN